MNEILFKIGATVSLVGVLLMVIAGLIVMWLDK